LRIDLRQETVLHARRHFHLGQSVEDPPRLLARGPLVTAERAMFDVLVRVLPPDRVERLGQQHRHAFPHEIAFRHRSPPRASPASAFFKVSMARKTLVLTAPSEQPEICAISAYESPW